MNEELIIIEATNINDDEVKVEYIEQDVEKEETIELIEVEEPEAVEIEIEESFGWTHNNGGVTHYGLADRNEPNQHTIGAIEGLRGELDFLGGVSTKKGNETIYHDHYSAHGGYAEFRRWGINSDINEVGRFVSLVYQHNNNPLKDGNTFIEVCSAEHSDVYGVTVQNSAFCGYQDENYCILKASPDRNEESLTYAKVCILGVVSVRQGAKYQNAKVGDYVVPDDYGCAVLSDNEIGFRVVGVGQYSGASDPYWNYAYVDIALVPQNDNVARVMAELEGTKQGLGNLSIQIGKLENDINNATTSIIPDIEQTLDDMNDTISQTQDKLNASQKVLETAQEISQEAKDVIKQVRDDYKTAIADAQTAKQIAQDILLDVQRVESNMTVLNQYGDRIAGFFASAGEEDVTLATLVKQAGDVTLIKQKIDENGAAIQHLVAHADKYSVGKYSPTYGLSYEQALSILGQTGLTEASGYIYVPTETHTENTTVYDWLESKVITFEKGQVYVWKRDSNASNDMAHRWQLSTIKVMLNNSVPTEQSYGDLWYTWNGIVDENSVWIYEPQTLYRWTAYNETDGIWIAVARTNDGNARTMSFINQTAEEISSTVTNLEGNVSEISQTVDTISSTILGDDGIISRVNQTAEAITLGTYSPNKGMSSLEILLNGMRSTSSYTEHIKVGEFAGSVGSNVTKYETPPAWGDDGFSFNDCIELTEEKYPAYYFDSEKRTYYCEQKDNDTYVIYTIGNQAMANISTRVDDNESAITRLTQFETETGKRMTVVEEKSDENSAQILSIAQMNDDIRIDIKSELTESEIATFNKAIKYSEPPIWNVSSGKFEFQGESSEDGVYCILNDNKKYYQIIDTVNGQGYEQYEVLLSSVKYATIEQKVDENSASIGMVVESGSIKGGVIAEAINGQSEVTINANKIAINGTTTFADALSPNKTAISGNYIKTGVITSNNYSGPVTYRMYGAKLDKIETQKLSGNKICTFTTEVMSFVRPGTSETFELWGYAYIGDDLDLSEAEVSNQGTLCYCSYNGQIYQLAVDTYIFDGGKVYVYPLSDLPIPKGKKVDLYPRIEGTGVYKGIKIIGGELADCIYYSPIVNGELSITNYYYAKDIKMEAELFSTPDDCSYIVSDENFDLIPSGIETIGMRFDLDTGTIYSKNLILDHNGDLTITGRINATSGYIGDKDDGFEINAFYIGNSQGSLKGDSPDLLGTKGVFISPEGIGMGHGRFWVNNTGTRMSIAGAEMKHINQFDGQDTSIFGIVTSGVSGGIVFAVNDSFKDNYSWAAMRVIPKTPNVSTDSDGNKQYTSRSTIDVWASIDMHGNSISNQSDSRLKTNIIDSDVNAVDLLNSVELKSFDWIDSEKHVDVGLIAQQLERVIPGLVTTNEQTGLKGINYTDLIPYLIKAVQELSDIVNPPVALMSLNGEDTPNTHWEDNMSDTEKVHYVQLSRPPMFQSEN